MRMHLTVKEANSKKDRRMWCEARKEGDRSFDVGSAEWGKGDDDMHSCSKSTQMSEHQRRAKTHHKGPWECPLWTLSVAFSRPVATRMVARSFVARTNVSTGAGYFSVARMTNVVRGSQLCPADAV